MKRQYFLQFLFFENLNQQSDVSKPNKILLTDAIRTAYGTIHTLPLAIACMDFKFIGGSMGSVVGEKITQLINHCLAHQTPLLIISKSGGALIN
ncbi:Acetyl-coenzyme A carboxylase carboxyl transferase subunit beta, partial [Stegodyphus mimosarum]